MTLTREEIQGRKPGRELNALVAHYIFGWNILTDGRMESQDKFMIRPVPEYSTDISAAWEVLEHFTDKEITVKRYEGMDSNFRYVCWIVDDFIDIQEIAFTAPEAICKAALVARLNL